MQVDCGACEACRLTVDEDALQIVNLDAGEAKAGSHSYSICGWVGHKMSVEREQRRPIVNTLRLVWQREKHPLRPVGLYLRCVAESVDAHKIGLGAVEIADTQHIGATDGLDNSRVVAVLEGIVLHFAVSVVVEVVPCNDDTTVSVGCCLHVLNWVA